MLQLLVCQGQGLRKRTNDSLLRSGSEETNIWRDITLGSEGVVERQFCQNPFIRSAGHLSEEQKRNAQGSKNEWNVICGRTFIWEGSVRLDVACADLGTECRA